MSEQDFDPSLYASAPVLTIGGAIALVEALLEAALPKEHEPDNVGRARKKLQRAGALAKDALTARQKALGIEGSGGDPALDAEADNTWSALRMRLTAHTLLPDETHAKAPRAARVLAALFASDGLSFLKLAYPDQWAGMGARLEQIDEDELAKEVDALAGPEFLAHARGVQKRYGAMVRAMLQRDDATGERLIDHVRAVQRSVVDYATKVCGTVEDENEGSAGRARKALRAIEAHREAAARRQAGEGKEGVGEEGEKKEDASKGEKKG